MGIRDSLMPAFTVGPWGPAPALCEEDISAVFVAAFDVIATKIAYVSFCVNMYLVFRQSGYVGLQYMLDN